MKTLLKAPLLRNALLEIGVEEIPARFMPPALQQLSDLITKGLQEAGIEFAAVEVRGTPRRMSALIREITPKSKDRTDMVIGPPPRAAKDESGAWTAAATGFAKAQNTSVDKLILKETPKGERFVAFHLIKGQKTELVLKELFPAAIRSLNFPKSMIWDSKELRFARPIRWIVALYNTNVIRFRLGDVTSDRNTVGLLSLGGVKIPIPKPEKYKSILQGRCILVDAEDRKKNIRTQIEAAAKRLKGNVIASPDHLEEVVYLTEYPVSIVGHFPEAYLRLPREILISVLRKHQKFFPVESTKGQLTNSFIGVRNGPSESQEDVREGYERVINARLSDAQFFYEKDLQTPLEQLAPKLSGVGFHEKLGTMWDKTVRVRANVQKIASKLGLSSEVLAPADRGALLAKADLLTQMVGELPELQGIAGRFYAEKQESPEVAAVIEQHYWPLTTESELPKTAEAALVAIADKIDTLAANFSVGLLPTGSADPYGLRRMAVGIVRILLDRSWEISIDQLIETAFETLAETRPGQEKAAKELKEFFVQRCLTWFGNQGYRSDEIEAVLSNRAQSLAVLQQKLSGLKSIRGRTEFDALANAIKRSRNLLSQAKEKGFLPPQNDIRIEDLDGSAETSLYQALNVTRPKLLQALSASDYQNALLELAPLKAPVDAFFEGVMVMVDDENRRSQRLRLLMQVKELFDSLADFSKLQATE